MDGLEDVALDMVFQVESAAAELVQLGEHWVTGGPQIAKLAQL